MKTTTNLVLQHLIWRGLYFLSVFLINIGIARFFAAEKSGELFYIVNNLALVLLIVSLSLESGATYYVASGKMNAGLMGRICGIWAVLASLLAITGWASVLYFTDSKYLSARGFLPASFLFILGVLLTTYFTALFYAGKEFDRPNKILFITNGLFIILLFAGKNQLVIRNHFIEIYFSCFFIQGVLLAISFFRNYSLPPGPWISRWPELQKVLRYSLIALMANGIYFLLNRTGYWFVKYYCSPHDLGNYIQASKLAQMLFIVPAILGASLFPIFSSGEKSENAAQLTSAMRILLLINGIVCFVILGLGWYVIPFLFGPTFNNMYLLFVLMIPGILCVTINYPLAAWFSSKNRINVNITGSLLALLIVCAGSLLLLPHYGVRAAAIINSAGFFCYYCYTIYRYRKEYSFPWKDFLVIRRSDIIRMSKAVRDKMQVPAFKNPIV
jgi:O-antigen/teichoic acid export membrane protein